MPLLKSAKNVMNSAKHVSVQLNTVCLVGLMYKEYQFLILTINVLAYKDIMKTQQESAKYAT